MRNLSKSKAIMDEKSEYLFKAIHYIEPVLERGIGSWVWDIDGNKYLDLNAGQFCLSFGHGYEPFAKMVEKQLMKIYHTNTVTLTPEVFEAAEKMASITGYDLKKTMFLSTGSEANECALRYAKYATQKNGVFALNKGYHGLTLASQASTLGGQWAMPNVPGAIAIQTPDYMHANTGLCEREYIDHCIMELEYAFKTWGSETAAMILEPVIGVGGMIQIPTDYIKKVRCLCDEYNVILIFDECQCGFGRSGDWFVYQQIGVIPDMVVMAKAMGMGLAVGAVTFSEKIAEQVEGKLEHFSSHQNDALSAAIVSFMIDEIKDKNILVNNKRKGAYLLEALSEACAEVDSLCNPRGVGLMCAFDLDDSKVENCRLYSSEFIKKMEDESVLIQVIRQGRTFRVLPSYFINEDEIDFLKAAIVRAGNNM